MLENARKWSPEGAAVEVVLKDGVLTVRDHGPGFAEADLPFVFDRFYRAEEARKRAQELLAQDATNVEASSDLERAVLRLHVAEIRRHRHGRPPTQ